MIRCTPQGICSSNYWLEGLGHRAALEFSLMGEEGLINVDGVPLPVHKPTIFTSEWRLGHRSTPLIVARKVDVFTRSIELRMPGGICLLQAESIMSRSMRLSGAGMNCRIIPDHAFTRRATIMGDVGDFRITAFAFWLTALLWRRAASS